jgi:hypothetical protein
MADRPGNPINIYLLNPVNYQRGWDARLNREPWWHLNWLEASWRAGWADASHELDSNIELAKRNEARLKRKKKGTK